ncbi:unnamed protein product, partial [Ectocarpus fasciculatus]
MRTCGAIYLKGFPCTCLSGFGTVGIIRWTSTAHLYVCPRWFSAAEEIFHEAIPVPG